MSLLILSRISNGLRARFKTFAELSGQIMFATAKGRYHTHFVDLGIYSAIANEFFDKRLTRMPTVKFDDYGRIVRTRYWQ